jgi:Fe2+ transport system protein FeoA
MLRGRISGYLVGKVLILMQRMLKALSKVFSKKEAPKADFSQICPLHEVPQGQTVRVRHLSGQPAVCQRLREMGFNEQAQVKIINHAGAVLCVVCGAKVGLSRQLAESILVGPSNV